MQQNTPLHFLLAKEILKSYSSFSQFAKETNLSRSSLSLMFRQNNPKPIPFDYLIKITTTLNYAEDYFFDCYVNECFINDSPHKSRIYPFVIRCAELKRIDCIEDILKKLGSTFNERNIELIFDIIESLVETNEQEAIKILCDWIIEHEKNQNTHRNSIVRYRLFISSLGDDDSENLKRVENFFPFRHRLPIELKLQAFLELSNLYLISAKHKNSGDLAEELITLCIDLFGHKDNPKYQPQLGENYPLKHHPVFFYGHAYLLKESFLESTGQLYEAMACQKHYDDLEWFHDYGQPDLYDFTIQKFKIFAQANYYNVSLLLGDSTVLEKYSSFLENHPIEVLPSAISVLTAAERFGFNIDIFLNLFSFKLQEYLNLKNNAYSWVAIRNRYVIFLQKISVYHYNKGRFKESLQAALQSWELSSQTNNHSHLRALASLAVMYNTPFEPKIDS